MRVIVIGGGVAGLGAALALARTGQEAVVLERAERFAEVGAGLQLSPNAVHRLFAWGLEAQLRRLAFAPQAVEIRDRADGRLLLRTPLGADAEARWSAPYLQMHRADLLEALLEACRAAGVELRTGSPLQAFEDDGARVRVEAGGARLEGDVLVGADGVRSAVRDALFGPEPARFTGQIAWRGLVEAERLPQGMIAPAATVWTAPGAHLVAYYVRGGQLVNFVGFTRGERSGPESWSEPAAPGEIARAFAGWPAPVQALIAAQTQSGQSGWRLAVHDRPPRRDWTKGRAALLGDAAHPMPPYLAQGAGMAIEDAEALARHLGSAASPEAALQAYAGERFARVRRVQRWAERNGRIFHLPALPRRAAFWAARSGLAGDIDWLYAA